MRSESNPTSNDLLFKFNKRDDHAFSVIYQMFINDLYAYGLSLGCGKEQVKDIIQDVFFRIYFERNEFSTINQLKFYLFRSVKNGIYNLFKAKSSHTESFTDEDLNFSLTVNILDEIIEKEDQKIISQKINQILSKLSNREREAIYLRYLQGMEYSEISEIMNISQHSTRKLVSKAILRLQADNKLIALLLLLDLLIK